MPYVFSYKKDKEIEKSIIDSMKKPDDPLYKLVKSPEFEDWVNTYWLDRNLKDLDKLIGKYCDASSFSSWSYLILCKKVLYLLTAMSNTIDPIQDLTSKKNRDNIRNLSKWFKTYITTNIEMASIPADAGDIFICDFSHAQKLILDETDLDKVDIYNLMEIGHIPPKAKIVFNKKEYSPIDLRLEAAKKSSPKSFDPNDEGRPQLAGAKWFRISGGEDSFVCHYGRDKTRLGFYLKKNAGLQFADVPVFFKTYNEGCKFINKLGYKLNNKILENDMLYPATVDKDTKQNGFVKINTRYGTIYVQSYKAERLGITPTANNTVPY